MDNNVVARMYISTYNIIILKRSILRYNNDQSGWLVLNDQREESGSKQTNCIFHLTSARIFLLDLLYLLSFRE